MTIFAAPNNNVAFNKVLEVELMEAFVNYPRSDLDLKFALIVRWNLFNSKVKHNSLKFLRRESLYSVFGHVTTKMSTKQRRRRLSKDKSQMLWQLPEMVSSLQKDVFFFEPEEMVTKKEHKVG